VKRIWDSLASSLSLVGKKTSKAVAKVMKRRAVLWSHVRKRNAKLRQTLLIVVLVKIMDARGASHKSTTFKEASVSRALSIVH
jgi:hypothetical protein